MKKRPSHSLFSHFRLDPSSSTPLYRQIYETLREAILSGQLVAGTPLPSTRTLAETLNLSRSTVVLAFEQLFAEGYVEGRQGSATYVASILPLETPPLLTQSPYQEQTPQQPLRRISQRGQISPALTTPTIARAFQPGLPDFKHFPFATWSRLAAHHWRHAPQELLCYTDPAGYLPLRAEIAAYAKAVRGVHCEAEQVFITSGSQQGIDLASRVLLDPGDTAWIEDPCYPLARRALLSAGARLTYVPVDTEGLSVAAGIMTCPEARLVYITPSYQSPLGVTMSLQRRLQLLQWAQQTGAWIIEDDYNCEFRYTGRPLSSLQGLDRTAQVLYLGTYSKILFPALRLGYMIVPPDLIDAFRSMRATSDRQSSIMDQLVLTDFLTQGHFVRYIQRLRALYLERQQTLIEEVKHHLIGCIDIHASETGMHLVGTLPAGLDDTIVADQAARRGIVTPALSRYCIQNSMKSALLLGYTSVDPQEIRQGVQTLAEAVDHVMKIGNR